jgi:hypothetical protein
MLLRGDKGGLLSRYLRGHVRGLFRAGRGVVLLVLTGVMWMVDVRCRVPVVVLRRLV